MVRHILYDIEKPDADGDRGLTRIRFSVHICINITLFIIENKQGSKWRSEEFVGGSLGRGELTEGVLSPTTSSVTGDQTTPMTNLHR